MRKTPQEVKSMCMYICINVYVYMQGLGGAAVADGFCPKSLAAWLKIEAGAAAMAPAASATHAPRTVPTPCAAPR